MIDVCSATSKESPRRELLNDMAEQRTILKSNQNTYHVRFHTQNRYSIPQNGSFVFTVSFE